MVTVSGNGFQSRRAFLGSGSFALAGLALAVEPSMARETPVFSAMGMAAGLDRAAALKAAGASFLTESTGGFLVPDKGDDDFAANLAKLAGSPLPVLACNGFIRPRNLRCVGAEANHDDVLKWADTAFRRLKRAKGRFIVFGSADSRRLASGWPREKADAQFITLLKRMGPLAEAQGVTVVVEQLQPSECNFINRIGQAATLVRAAAHPHVRVLADLFHMMRAGDTPDDLKAAMDVVAHVEIAERENRTVPGVAGDDFRPFFRILKHSGYRGAINIEGKGSDGQLAKAFATIARQAAEA